MNCIISFNSLAFFSKIWFCARQNHI